MINIIIYLWMKTKKIYFIKNYSKKEKNILGSFKDANQLAVQDIITNFGDIAKITNYCALLGVFNNQWIPEGTTQQ